MCVHSITITHNKLLLNVFLETSFGSKGRAIIRPLHKIKVFCVVADDGSILELKLFAGKMFTSSLCAIDN